MVKLKQIEKLSPVPVRYKDVDLASGYYVRDDLDELPGVVVKKSLKTDQKIIILLHEIGHAVCDKKRCKCQHPHKKAPSFLTEYHAMKFVLDYLVKCPDKKLITIFVNTLSEITYYHPVYLRVKNKIGKLKEYKSLIAKNLEKEQNFFLQFT